MGPRSKFLYMRRVVVSNPQPIRLSDLTLGMRTLDRWLPVTFLEVAILGREWGVQEITTAMASGSSLSRKSRRGFSPILFQSPLQPFLDVTQRFPQRNGYSQPNHILLFCQFVFVVCLHFVEQTKHIIAKCQWRKIDFARKACGTNNEWFLAFVSRRTHATRNGLCSRATIIADEKKCEWKSQVQVLHVKTGEKSGIQTRCQQIERSYLIS